MSDPVLRIAQLRIIKVSADLEAQIGALQGSAPTIAIMRRLQHRAAESLVALAFVNTFADDGMAKIRMLQNEVKRYDEFFTCMRELIHEGIALDKQFDEDERNELLDILMKQGDGERQAVAMGLIDEGPTD